MTDATLVLSQENQTKIAESADAIAQRSGGKAKNAALVTLGALATVATFTLALPAAPLAGVLALAGGIVAFFAGARAIGHFATERAMSGVKKDAGKENFVDNMKNRAARFRTFHKIADKVADYGILGVVANFAAGALFPPYAPVAAAIHTPLFWTWIGGGTVRDSLKPAMNSADELNRVTEQKAPKDSLVAILTPSNAGPSKVTQAPAPAVAFEKAANANAPAEQAPAQKSAFRRFLHI